MVLNIPELEKQFDAILKALTKEDLQAFLTNNKNKMGYLHDEDAPQPRRFKIPMLPATAIGWD